MVKEAIILVGHGGTATDMPKDMISELKGLEARRHAQGGGPMSAREAELDAKVRSWPRTAETDPYKFGLERVAEALSNTHTAPSTIFPCQGFIQQSSVRACQVWTVSLQTNWH